MMKKFISCKICTKKVYIKFNSQLKRQTCGGKCRDKLVSQKLKGKIFTKEHLENMRNSPNRFSFPKGNQLWKRRDHKKMSEKISKAMERPEVKKKLSNSIKQKWQDKEYREKCIKSFRKKKLTPEHKENITKGLLKNPIIRRGTCLGRKFSDEINKKKGRSGNLNAMSKLEHRLKLMGSNCHLWEGGIACEPYAPGFISQLKEVIKKIDSHICQNCKTKPDILSIHHIDYNKENHSLNNLISLCNKCHSKTNTKRENWKEKFTELSKNERQKNIMAFGQPFHHILRASSC